MTQNNQKDPNLTNSEGDGYDLAADPDQVAEEHHKNTNYLLRRSIDFKTDLKVDKQKYCRKCGYNLFGLRSGICPECGRRFDSGNPATYCTSPHIILAQHSCDIKAVFYPLVLTVLPVLVFYLVYFLHLVLDQPTPTGVASEFITLLNSIARFLLIAFLVLSPFWVGFTFFVTMRTTTPYQKLATNLFILIAIALFVSLPFLILGPAIIFPMIIYTIIAILLAFVQEWISLKPM